jgi:hypothetical protein
MSFFNNYRKIIFSQEIRDEPKKRSKFLKEIVLAVGRPANAQGGFRRCFGSTPFSSPRTARTFGPPKAGAIKLRSNIWWRHLSGSCENKRATIFAGFRKQKRKRK